MKLMRCDICHKDVEDLSKIHRVQIKGFKSLTELTSKSLMLFDVCHECIYEMFNLSEEDPDGLEEAADDSICKDNSGQV